MKTALVYADYFQLISVAPDNDDDAKRNFLMWQNWTNDNNKEEGNQLK